MTHFDKSLVVVLLSSILIFFMSSGHVNESVDVIIDILNIRFDKMEFGPIITQKFIILFAVGVIGFIGIKRR